MPRTASLAIWAKDNLESESISNVIKEMEIDTE